MGYNGICNSITNPKWRPTQKGGKLINLLPLDPGIELKSLTNEIQWAL